MKKGLRIKYVFIAIALCVLGGVIFINRMDSIIATYIAVKYSDGNKDCWICDKKFLFRKSRNVYFMELSSLTIFELDVTSKDIMSLPIAILKDSTVNGKRYYEERQYGILAIHLKSQESLLTDAEDAEEYLCEECLLKLGYGNGVQQLPNYSVIDFKSDTLYPIVATKGISHAPVGDFMIFYDLKEDTVNLILVRSPKK